MKKARGYSLPDSECYTRLMPSRIHGVGVFAIRDIPKGTNIFKDDASKMVWIDAKKVADKNGQIRKLYEDFCVHSKGKWGCPKGFNNLTVAWYLNQPLKGGKPNVVCGEEYDFFTARDIAAGEELTVDYSTYNDDTK
jgi:SET domain-containing protein